MAPRCCREHSQCVVIGVGARQFTWAGGGCAARGVGNERFPGLRQGAFALCIVCKMGVTGADQAVRTQGKCQSQQQQGCQKDLGALRRMPQQVVLSSPTPIILPVHAVPVWRRCRDRLC